MGKKVYKLSGSPKKQEEEILYSGNISVRLITRGYGPNSTLIIQGFGSSWIERFIIFAKSIINNIIKASSIIPKSKRRIRS